MTFGEANNQKEIFIKMSINTHKRNTRSKLREREMANCLKIAITVMGLLLFCNIVTSTPDTNITSVLCNADVYTTGDPFGQSLSYILNDIETTTPTYKNYFYYNISPYPNAFAYGHAYCNTNLTTPDCTTCLAAAKIAMLGTCQSRIGARGVLHDCSVRYEQYPFTD